MKNLESKIMIPIDKIKETSLLIIIIFSVLFSLNSIFLNFVVFKLEFLKSFETMVAGIINRTLIANLFSIIIFVFIILMKFGRLSFFDLGIKKDKVFSAIIGVIILWVIINLVNIVIGIFKDGSLSINYIFTNYKGTVIFGEFIAQLLGNCLLEEIVFRGFLLVQIYKKFKNSKFKLFTSILISQMIFALIHIPNRIMQGMDFTTILQSVILVFFIGVLFSIIYIATDNIFLAVGVHLLWNLPLIIVEQFSGAIIMVVLTLLLSLIFKKTLRKIEIKDIEKEIKM